MRDAVGVRDQHVTVATFLLAPAVGAHADHAQPRLVRDHALRHLTDQLHHRCDFIARDSQDQVLVVLEAELLQSVELGDALRRAQLIHRRKALGEKIGDDKEADTIAIIRTLIFVQLVITNCFIVAGNIRHWNDHYTPPQYEVINGVSCTPSTT